MHRAARVGIVLQARMGSGRLPGKALVDLAGKPLLRRLLDRMCSCRSADIIVVATSESRADDILEKACSSWGVPVHRGPEVDLTTRLLGAARQHELTALVRVTGDNPLTDPQGVDELIAVLHNSGAEVTHNCHSKGYPYGTGTEVVRTSAIEACDRELKTQEQRELFMGFIRRQPQRFPCVKVNAPPDLYRPDVFLTVDYPEDWQLLEKIYARLSGRDNVPLRKVIEILDAEPALARINSGLHQGFEE